MVADAEREPSESPAEAEVELAALGGEELTFALPGLTLAARAWGPADGRPVLALHGWLDNGGSFARLAPLLPGLRLVALDMAGHGRSGWRNLTASYDFVNWLPDVHHALDALGWQRCALLGHSLGAGVAVCFAGTFPQRIDRLALIDGMGPLSTPAEEAPQRLQTAIERQARMRRMRVPSYPDRAAMAERLCAAIPGLDEPSASTLLVRGARPARTRSDASARDSDARDSDARDSDARDSDARDSDAREELSWSHDPRLRGSSLLRLSEPQVAAFMKRVACPTLLLRARQGWPVDAADAARRCGYLDTLQLEHVEGCHHVHLVTPANIATQLATFFDA
jgi:pimeloyl-ACP methyl ester carboxylesterase